MESIIKTGTSAKNINKVLQQGGNIIFQKGTYKLNVPLVLYSNTNVTCEDGVVFKRNHTGRMLTTYIDKDSNKYNGVHNVTWKGGTFKADTNSSAALVIVICHSKNIVFDGVTVDGCINLHSIEINSSAKVRVINSIFKNQKFKEGESHKEAIQIDFCYKGGLAISGASANSPCYDYTHCKDIEISNCVFTNVPNGIGTHVVSEQETYHSDIKITNCVFDQISGNCIRLLGMKNVTIVGNKFPTDGKLVVDKVSSAHTSTGKVKIPTRYNVNVNVDNSNKNVNYVFK